MYVNSITCIEIYNLVAFWIYYPTVQAPLQYLDQIVKKVDIRGVQDGMNIEPYVLRLVGYVWLKKEAVGIWLPDSHILKIKSRNSIILLIQ